VTGYDTQAGGEVRATVEMAHDALMRRWPTLRTWVDGNREKLRMRAAILRANAEWEGARKNDGYLLRPGIELERGRALLEIPDNVPVDDIRDYVDRSIEKEKRDLNANQGVRMYSCFISYSSKDHDFAERLYADLQNKGVRCWFAPHDLPIGAKTWDAIDEAIKVRDKLLVVLSDNSIGSDWVEDEVNEAFAEERARNQLVLFPVRIDDTAMTTSEPWARKLRNQRNIGDFRDWKDHDAYHKSLIRLLRDLAVSAA
jgi:hypothetical protein